MLRLDITGSILYSNQYDDASLDDGVTASSAYMLESNSFTLAGNGRTNASNRFVIKFDSLFNIQWSQKFSFPTVNVISSIAQTQDSGFVFIASPNGSASAHYCLMIKINSSGAVSWAKQFQYASFRSPLYDYERNSGQNTLIITPDNGIAFCGFFLDTISTNNKDLVLIKTDANGNILCDGITVNVTSSPLSFVPSAHTNFISRGLFMTTTLLTTSQSSLPTTTICYDFPTSANEIIQENDFMILPNPHSGIFTLQSAMQPLNNSTIVISNTLGEIIYEQNIFAAQTEINLSRQSAGIYFVQVKNEKQILVKKILVVK